MDKTVQSQELLLELIYCQAAQASDPWFGYQGKEEHKQLDKHTKLHPSSFPASASLIFATVITSLSKLLWHSDGWRRKWKWYQVMAFCCHVCNGFCWPALHDSDPLCVTVSAVLDTMASAALVLSVPTLAWVTHGCVFSPYGFHFLQGRLEPFSAHIRSWVQPVQVTTANQCYVQPATSAHCSRYSNRDGFCIVIQDGGTACNRELWWP